MGEALITRRGGSGANGLLLPYVEVKESQSTTVSVGTQMMELKSLCYVSDDRPLNRFAFVGKLGLVPFVFTELDKEIELYDDTNDYTLRLMLRVSYNEANGRRYIALFGCCSRAIYTSWCMFGGLASEQ